MRAKTAIPINSGVGPGTIINNMNACGRALWYIEAHGADDVTLEDVAANAGVSPFHLTRAFALVHGLSVMRYLRGRRLTEAAKLLARGAPDILTVALAAGYNSHEAFTRAFREQFGITPEGLRQTKRLDQLNLVEAIEMDATPNTLLEAPRLATSSRMLVAGLNRTFNNANSAGIPGQWQEFSAYIGRIAGQVGKAAYGVIHNFDDDGRFDSLCGVEVGSVAGIEAPLSCVEIPAMTYAVFRHDGHVSTIRGTWNAVWNEGLKGAGLTPIGKLFFERYGEEFDAQTGWGGCELWVPIEPR